ACLPLRAVSVGCALMPGVGMIASFFFSSRRRHTRWPRDWSSDVCSSDLNVVLIRVTSPLPHSTTMGHVPGVVRVPIFHVQVMLRSEERRVGKEGRSRWATDQ